MMSWVVGVNFNLSRPSAPRSRHNYFLPPAGVSRRLLNSDFSIGIVAGLKYSILRAMSLPADVCFVMK